MNRVIHRELAASELPDDLRGDIDPTHRVRVVVEDIGAVDPARTAAAQRIRALAGIGRDMDVSIEEAVRRVRELRDE